MFVPFVLNYTTDLNLGGSQKIDLVDVLSFCSSLKNNGQKQLRDKCLLYHTLLYKMNTLNKTTGVEIEFVLLQIIHFAPFVNDVMQY